MTSRYLSANDDLGGTPQPYKCVAVIPVKGRRPLLSLTIRRLYQKNGVWKVITVGDDPEDRKVCEDAGALWVQHPNKPLGNKWNAGFWEARMYEPDSVLYVGSSDWISDNWIPTMRPYVKQHDLVGTPGCYFADLGDKIRVCHWAGYVGSRSTESIGIGRMISGKLLDTVGWKPFSDHLDNSLDRSMKDRCKKDYLVLENIKSVSISTNLWPNKHFFSHHWLNVLPSTKVSDVPAFLKEFPELNELYDRTVSRQ